MCIYSITVFKYSSEVLVFLLKYFLLVYTYTRKFKEKYYIFTLLHLFDNFCYYFPN